jgi:membrane protein implicated in regulation of membrane protease activity
VVSAVLLFFTRPIAMKYFNRDRERTNAESLVGRQAIVISEINNLQGIGQVTINGMEWTARSIMDDHIIEPGEVVIVRGINGVKLLVEDRKDFEKKEEQLLENNMN